MLINQGKCDVNDNFEDPVRNSPLHYCIVFNQLQFFIILLKFKYTNINKINLNGDTPLDFACENVIYNHEYYLNKEFAKLLIQHGGKTNNMNHKYNELIKILTEEGDDDFGEENKKIHNNNEKKSEINTKSHTEEKKEIKDSNKDIFENKSSNGKNKENKDKTKNNNNDNLIEDENNKIKKK